MYHIDCTYYATLGIERTSEKIEKYVTFAVVGTNNDNNNLDELVESKSIDQDNTNLTGMTKKDNYN